MPIQLHSLRFENTSAPTLILMHGLLGSSRNWTTIGKALQKDYDVHALDLRNHGSSPHAESMRWSELVADLEQYRKANDLDQFILLGHSLGGKVAMRYACEYPGQVSKLVIVDIAAKAYSPHHDGEFRAMKRIPVSELTNRKEAEELLTPLIEDWALRQFVMTNLVRSDEGGFKWQINLEGLHASLSTIRQHSLLDSSRFEGPSLLIIGGKSDFIGESDFERMKDWFPLIDSVVIPDAGHNVHVEDRKGFLRALSDFL